jgi:hypothetical protein
MGRRPLLVMVLGWFAVVGAVGAITFVVVSNAGSGVGVASAGERVFDASPTAPGSATATATPTPSVTPTAPVAPTTSTSPQPSVPNKPSDTPEPEPTSKAPRPTAPAADPRTASFSTEGGIVVATCRGARISVVSVRPRDDWRFDPELERGALEVTFKTTGREVEIYLRCVDEVPTRLKPGAHWGAGDSTSSDSRSPHVVHPEESPSPQLVHPPERVHSEGLEHATPTASSTPSSTASSTEETPHG